MLGASSHVKMEFIYIFRWLSARVNGSHLWRVSLSLSDGDQIHGIPWLHTEATCPMGSTAPHSVQSSNGIELAACQQVHPAALPPENSHNLGLGDIQLRPWHAGEGDTITTLWHFLGVLVEKAISHGESMVSRAQGFREYGEFMQRVSHLLIKQT